MFKKRQNQKSPRRGYDLSIFSRIASAMNLLRLSVWALSHLNIFGDNLIEVDTKSSSGGFLGRPPAGLRRPPRLDFWVIGKLAIEIKKDK